MSLVCVVCVGSEIGRWGSRFSRVRWAGPGPSPEPRLPACTGMGPRPGRLPAQGPQPKPNRSSSHQAPTHPGHQRNLAGNVDKAVGLDGLGVGAHCRGGGLGGDHFARGCVGAGAEIGGLPSQTMLDPCTSESPGNAVAPYRKPWCGVEQGWHGGGDGPRRGRPGCCGVSRRALMRSEAQQTSCAPAGNRHFQGHGVLEKIASAAGPRPAGPDGGPPFRGGWVGGSQDGRPIDPGQPIVRANLVGGSSSREPATGAAGQPIQTLDLRPGQGFRGGSRPLHGHIEASG